MGRKLREFDWVGTPLGAPATWSQSLRVAVRLLLTSNVPMGLWWGEDLVQLYNDAYRVALGPLGALHALGMDKHGRADNVWVTIGPAIEAVLNGRGPVSGSGIPLLTAVDDTNPAVYWDFSFCPIDLDGAVGGVLGFVKNVSEDRLDDERLDRTSAQLIRLFEDCPGFICVLSGPEHVFEFVNAEYRSVMGERNYIGQAIRSVIPELDGQGFFAALDSVYRTGETYVGRNVQMRYQHSVRDESTQIEIDFAYKALVSPSGDVYGIFVEGTSVGNRSSKHLRSDSPRLLTAREREVLGWIALGKTAADTAGILNISKRTCESHIYSAARKLEAVNSIQAVVEAIRRG